VFAAAVRFAFTQDCGIALECHASLLDATVTIAADDNTRSALINFTRCWSPGKLEAKRAPASVSCVVSSSCPLRCRCGVGVPASDDDGALSEFVAHVTRQWEEAQRTFVEQPHPRIRIVRQ
jgi:hypothetical protein